MANTIPQFQLIQLPGGKLAIAIVRFYEDGRLYVSIDDYLFEHGSREEILKQIDEIREAVLNQEPLATRKYNFHHRHRPIF